MSRRLILTTTALLSLSVAATAEARAFRVTQIPNGGAFGCTTCHETYTGGPRNSFGTAVFYGITSTPSTAPAGWGPLLAGQDSDSDGFTNGQELGDPNGVWQVGDPDPTFDATNPADPLSFPTRPGEDTGVDAEDDTSDPDTGSDDTSGDPDTGADDTSIEAETTVDPDTTPEPDSTAEADATTDDVATTADTGTTGTTDDRKVASDDGCSSGGNSASLLGLFGLALLARRRRA